MLVREHHGVQLPHAVLGEERDGRVVERLRQGATTTPRQPHRQRRRGAREPDSSSGARALPQSMRMLRSRPSGWCARTRTDVFRRRLCDSGELAPSRQVLHVGGSAVRQGAVGTWLEVPATTAARHGTQDPRRASTRAEDADVRADAQRPRPLHRPALCRVACRGIAPSTLSGLPASADAAPPTAPGSSAHGGRCAAAAATTSQALR